MKEEKIVLENLIKEKIKNMSGDDYKSNNLNGDEIIFVREMIRSRREAAIRRDVNLRIEQIPILRELSEMGYNVESVWDLTHYEGSYEKAIPLLLKHLLLPYSDTTRDSLARALAIKEAKSAWPILVDEYRKAPVGKGLVAPNDTKEFRWQAKDGLACALSTIVDASTLDTLISLIKDPENGDSRTLLLPGLKKFRSEIAKAVLWELAEDPVFKEELSSWRKRQKRIDGGAV
jgi:hypothetical protein